MTTIIAIDLETTGLVPEEGQILEAQCYELSPDLVVKSEFYGIFPRDKGIPLDPFIVNLHTKSGLLASEPICELSDLENYLNNFDEIIFLGNSVTFDKSWLIYHFPSLEKRFHYRIIDTSSILSLCPELRINTPHRAKPDIVRSVEIARLAQYAIRQQGVSYEKY